MIRKIIPKDVQDMFDEIMFSRMRKCGLIITPKRNRIEDESRIKHLREIRRKRIEDLGKVTGDESQN